MNNHLDESMSLALLSSIASISKFHLVRVFKDVTGVSPHLFLASLRIQMAKHLLLTTDLPVTEICFSVGYSSLGTFSYVFHRLVGLTPSSLRAVAKDYTTDMFYAGALDFARLQRSAMGPFLEGQIAPTDMPGGLIFVGAFERALPSGRPLSGAVVLGPGRFRCSVPVVSDFCLLAVWLPFDVLPFGPASSATRVARLIGISSQNADKLDLTLSLGEPEIVDPPLVVALPTLIA
jgi:AraC-like DNA-binding protein